VTGFYDGYEIPTKKALIRAFHSISPAKLSMKFLIEKRHT